MSLNKETLRDLQAWTARTEAELKAEAARMDVKDTDALRQGLEAKLRELTDAQLEITIKFKDYGRFVDMGVGRTREQNNALLVLKGKGRKARPFYSKTFYGRLHGLYGMVGYRMVEELMNSFQILKEV